VVSLVIDADKFVPCGSVDSYCCFCTYRVPILVGKTTKCPVAANIEQVRVRCGIDIWREDARRVLEAVAAARKAGGE